MNSSCLEIFSDFFLDYCNQKNKSNLKFIVTSGYRPGDIKTNPHALPGHAIDIVLKYKNNQYAMLGEYRDLFKYMFQVWPFRAGIDDTETETKKGEHPNVHIHIDIGENRPVNQQLPFFFKEDNQIYQYQITNIEQI